MSALDGIRGLLLDMDGVIYRGPQLLPGVPAWFDFLRTQGIPFVLVTNNSSRMVQQMSAHLAHLGLTIAPDEILTSAQATALYLQEHAPAGATVLPVGHEGLRTALYEAGFTLVDAGPADYVVAGVDWQFKYDTIKRAGQAIRAGAAFIGTNPDRTFPAHGEIWPGAGTMLAALTAYTGVEPLIIGKPALPLIELALNRLHLAPAQAALVGDRLETDILAGQRAGLLAILVLTGVTQRADLATTDIRPDLVFQDLTELRQAWPSDA
ncbi:MAG: HAD-IIA family hydrolase [Chloroflexi bacterium]|nr:HAD-IIA family hydrolase [Chloroflexota bacterium]MBU1751875.1 HAD-IIA family hydrolase [Chloroflexota bacterium]MBU1880348.1 HAD-IIA family hydrolase [Chloroflexota bacterium]